MVYHSVDVPRTKGASLNDVKHNIVRMEPLLPTEYDLEGGHLAIQKSVEIHSSLWSGTSIS